MEKINCKHESTYYGPSRPYSGSVSKHDENRAAHGGTSYTEFCPCGKRRDINSNGPHLEVGPWCKAVA